LGKTPKKTFDVGTINLEVQSVSIANLIRNFSFPIRKRAGKRLPNKSIVISTSCKQSNVINDFVDTCAALFEGYQCGGTEHFEICRVFGCI
jgi:hypothetical protein